MLNPLIKRTVLEGGNTIKSILFAYQNKQFLTNAWAVISDSLGEEYIPISKPKITSTNVLYFKGKHPKSDKYIICKVPLDKEAGKRAKINYQNISSLTKTLINSPTIIPSPVAIIKTQYGDIYIESLFKGTNGQDTLKGSLISVSHLLSQGINSIKDLQDYFPHSSVVINQDWISSLIGEISPHFVKSDMNNRIPEDMFKLLEKVNKENIILGFSHGDFWLGNLIFDQGNLIGIIDWDRFRLNGPVLYDQFHLELFYKAMKNSRSLGEEVVSSYKKQPSKDLILYWCYFFRNSITSNPYLAQDKRWMEKNYKRVIQNLV